MRKLIKGSVSLMVLFFAANLRSASSFAAEAGINLYPVKGIFVAEEKERAKAGRISKDFESAFDRKAAISFYQEEFKKLFGNMVSNITEQNKFKTFAASVQIIRASKYQVEKPNGTVDTYLPVTLSFYITNPMTSEVIFRNTQTEYPAPYNEPKGAQDASKVKKLYNDTFKSLLSDALKNAKEKFIPFAIETHIKTDWKGYLVFDRGLDEGISKGDTLTDAKGNQVSIIHAGNKYAVGLPLLGNPDKDAAFVKFSNTSVADLKKPRALVLNGGSPEDFSGEVPTQLFSDALGNKASFSIVPINRTFAAVQKAYVEDTKVSQKVTRSREVPEFFIRTKLLDPSFYEKPSSKDYVTYQTYHTVGFAELLDVSGRIHYSAMAVEKIEDEIIHQVAFDKNARREIVLKNVLTQLAQDFSTNVNFKKVEIRVVDTKENEMTLEDPMGVLAAGASPVLYHSIGSVSDIAEEVRIPIWTVSVSGRKDNIATAQKILPTKAGAPEPTSGDLLVFDSVSNSVAAKSATFGNCGTASNLGGTAFSEFEDFARFIAAKNSPGPFFVDKSFENDVASLVNPTNGFTEKAGMRLATPKYCLDSVYQVNSTAARELCGEKNSFCNQDVTLVTGYRLKSGKTEIDSFALSVDVHVPITAAHKDQIIRSELFDRAAELLNQNMKAVNEKQF